MNFAVLYHPRTLNLAAPYTQTINSDKSDCWLVRRLLSILPSLLAPEKTEKKNYKKPIALNASRKDKIWNEKKKIEILKLIGILHSNFNL